MCTPHLLHGLQESVPLNGMPIGRSVVVGLTIVPGTETDTDHATSRRQQPELSTARSAGDEG